MRAPILFHAVCLCAAAASASPALGATRASATDGYKRPTVTVPYAYSKPTIDGTVGDQEWQGAESMNALQTVDKQVSARQTRFWMMWDEDNLYVAMRSPLRPGERVIQALRRRSREVNVVFDDSYEIWLDVGTNDPKTGLVCFFQFLSNFPGARLDTLHLPSVGNSRLTFNTGWMPENRITPDGSAWEFELTIPRSSVFLEKPFEDGFAFNCLLARNFKRPWEQCSVEGTGSFSVLETYSRFCLSKTAPALHVLAVSDYKERSFGLHLAASSREREDVKWRFISDGGLEKEGTLSIEPGRLASTSQMLSLEKEGAGAFRIQVTSADGRTTYLDWASRRAFGGADPNAPVNDAGDVVRVNPSFNPVHNYVRVTGDFIQYDDRDRIETVRVEAVDGSLKRLGGKDLKIDDLAYIEGVIPLGDIPYGTYTARVICRDAQGAEVLTRESTFQKKDHEKEFKWWNTSRGNMDTVLAPWTFVTFNGQEFGVWGRSMALGAAGLPSQVVTGGRSILASPAVLVAEMPDGRTLSASAHGPLRTSFDENYRKIVECTGLLGDLAVKSEVQVEYDGLYKVTMTITPRRPVEVTSLRLKVPFTNEAAEYIHAAGEGIRTGFNYGFLPREGTGAIWTCKTVDSQPMAAGSFIPYVWVGSTTGGMCWFADSDEGWVPHETTPAIEVRRDSVDSTDLVLNLISEPFVIDAPRTITFALQASPVKPMHDKWRMDSWWTGDTFMDFACCGSVIWSAIPYCRDNETCKQMVAKQHGATNGFIFGVNKYRANAVPYFIHQALPSHLVPEAKYFGDQWQTSISECLYYGKTLSDYMVHSYGEWAAECGIDGYYVDNMRPVACDNIEAGRGYRLPDSRVQPTYQMFSTRRYFMRVRAAFAEEGKHDRIVLHMTNNMIIPWVGAADIAYDGEHHVIYSEMNKDFMDFWSLERMRVDYPAQWGVAVNFMHEYQGKWDRERELLAMRAYTGLVGLHDALPSGNANGNNPPFWIGRDRFGIEADDVEFSGYWRKDAGVECSAKDVYISFWKRPGKVLLLVVNKGEKTAASIRLDARRLGLGSSREWVVTDAEDGTKMDGRRRKGEQWEEFTAWSNASELPVSHAGNGLLSVPVKRHDYRQIIVGSGQ